MIGKFSKIYFIIVNIFNGFRSYNKSNLFLPSHQYVYVTEYRFICQNMILTDGESFLNVSTHFFSFKVSKL